MKKRAIILILLSLFLIISGCDTPPLSNTDANRMMEETLSATQTEVVASMSVIGSTSKSTTRSVFTDSYTNGDGSFYISVTVNDDNPADITWDGDITYTDFTTVNGSLLNGNISVTLSMQDYNNFSFHYEGNLTIVFEGETYDVDWNINFQSSLDTDTSTLTFTYTGTFMVNGYEYTYSYSYSTDYIT